MVDAERYRALFVQEARDHLQELDAGLHALASLYDRTAVDALFRAAHSFKGMAATLGYTAESELADALEDHLSALRERGEAPADLLDRLIAAADALAESVDRVETGESRPDLGDQIRALRATAETAPSAPADPDLAALEAAAHDLPADKVRLVHLGLAPATAAPRARLLIVRRILATLGKIVASSPPEAAWSELSGGDRLTILVASEASPEVIQQRLVNLPDLDHHEVATGFLPQTAGGTTRTGEAVLPDPAADAAAAAAPTAAPWAAEYEEEGAGQPAILPRSIRVPLVKVDGLLDQAAELRIAYSRLEQRLDDLFVGGRPYPVAEALEHLLREAKDIHDTALDLRTLPVRVLTDRFPRLVRSLSRRLDKDVDLVLEGEDVQADRSVLEALLDPLTHLVKNALDHGFEPADERRGAGKPTRGTLRVAFLRSPFGLRVVVADDGRGIPREAAMATAIANGLITPDEAAQLDDEQVFRLLSTPGFSTAKEVTEVSGRGVGLDAVKDSLERVGGSMRIASKKGAGTTVTLELPPSLALQEALEIRIDGEPYYIPVESILTTVAVDPAARERGIITVIDPGADDADQPADGTTGGATDGTAPRPTVHEPSGPSDRDPSATAPTGASERPTGDVRLVDLAALLGLPPTRYKATPEDRDTKVERLKARLREAAGGGPGRARRHGRRNDDQIQSGVPLGVVVERHDERACLLVEQVGLIREIVVKAFDVPGARARHVSGATIQGDGKVGLILDIPSILLSPTVRPLTARR